MSQRTWWAEQWPEGSCTSRGWSPRTCRMRCSRPSAAGRCASLPRPGALPLHPARPRWPRPDVGLRGVRPGRRPTRPPVAIRWLEEGTKSRSRNHVRASIAPDSGVRPSESRMAASVRCHRRDNLRYFAATSNTEAPMGKPEPDRLRVSRSGVLGTTKATQAQGLSAGDEVDARDLVLRRQGHTRRSVLRYVGLGSPPPRPERASLASRPTW